MPTDCKASPARGSASEPTGAVDACDTTGTLHNASVKRSAFHAVGDASGPRCAITRIDSPIDPSAARVVTNPSVNGLVATTLRHANIVAAIRTATPLDVSRNGTSTASPH